MKKYTNNEVSEYLTNIATAYEIKHKTRFQINAYQNAADTILTYPETIYNLWLKDPLLLDSVPNIGPSILKKIDYLFKTGKTYPSLKKIFSNIHPAVFTFTKINGIGPLIAEKLTQQLKFSSRPNTSLDQLVKYAQKDKIKNIPSFGEKSQTLILNNTLAFLGRTKRMSLASATKLSNDVINYLKQKFPHTQFIPLGSLRRQLPNVGDIDIAGASTNSSAIINYFLNYPKSIATLSKGKDKASIRLQNDVHVDLMIKPTSSFGSLIQHFTGSKQHNIYLRKLALKKGLKISEYGIKDLKSGILHQFDTEEKFYHFLGLDWIPPEKR